MDAFSYLSVLLSIILGLALTQLLQGLRGIALYRARVRLYLPVIAWSATLTLVFVQSWWAMFGLRRHTDWTFLQFFTVVTHTVLLYMLSAIILPDFEEEAVDLRVHFLAQRRLFGLLLVGTAVVSLLKDLVMDGRLPSPGNVVFHGVFAAFALGTILSTRDRIQRAISLGALGSFILYTTLLFGALG